MNNEHIIRFYTRIVRRLKRSSLYLKWFSSPSTMKIGNLEIKIPAGHALPEILDKWPKYSSNLPRLVSKSVEKYPSLLLIDIGANIGDTVALVRKEAQCSIVCIEGDTEYFELLSRNVSNLKGVTIYKHFLGEKNESAQVILKKENGTAQIIESHNKLKLITLDTFMDDHPEYTSAKILKIDTDGYDLKIIRGGLKYIRETKPILFIEYDEVHLSHIHDDGLSTLVTLKESGYNKVIFYDNFGRFLLSTELRNCDLIKELHAYIKGKRGSFPYYDLCIFHNEDDDIALDFIKEELSLN